MYIPRCRNIPSRHPTSTTILTQLVGTFITESAIEYILTIIRIGSVTIECHGTRVGILQRVVNGILFLTLLEELIYIEWNLARCILHTPTIKPSTVTVDAVGLHTTKEVQDVNTIKRLVELCGSTEIIVQHTVVCTLIDTTLWQDSNRQ